MYVQRGIRMHSWKGSLNVTNVPLDWAVIHRRTKLTHLNQPEANGLIVSYVFKVRTSKKWQNTNFNPWSFTHLSRIYLLQAKLRECAAYSVCVCQREWPTKCFAVTLNEGWSSWCYCCVLSGRSTFLRCFMPGIMLRWARTPGGPRLEKLINVVQLNGSVGLYLQCCHSHSVDLICSCNGK